MPDDFLITNKTLNSIAQTYENPCHWNVTNHDNFSMTSELLSMYEYVTIVGRPDMTMLLKQKVDKKLL